MAFDWSNPYPSVRTPVFARNVVATSQPLAAQAGLAALRAGGSAVDAAVAAAAVITLTEPCSNGLGADNFAIVWDPAGGQLHGLNASGFAPAAWDLAYFRGRYGDDLAANRPLRGWDTVTVPGAVAGWSLLHGRFGRLPWADVLAPALDYAQRGFAVSPVVQEKWTLAAPQLERYPTWAQHFLPKGRVPHVGEHFVLDGAARTFDRLIRHGAEDYYRGEIAQAIARCAQADGAALSAADLAAYWDFVHAPGNGWVGTVEQDYAGHTVHEIPPNGQGIAAAIALGILQHTPLADAAIDSADWQHAGIEAMKLAFADVYAHVADARAMRVSTTALLDPGYLRERARQIDMSRAQAFATGLPPRGGTIYLAAADAQGMMVSLIQSNYMGFGSGIVVPGWGISLQNRGHGFAFDAAHPNAVQPHHRPFHTIIPGFLMHAGAPQMAFGVMGGNMQPQGHLQTLARMLVAGQQPQAACDAPRWKFMQGLDIEVENAMPVAVVEELQRRGHRITRAFDSYMDFGSGQFIWRLGDPGREGYVAASDSRRDGHAAAF